MGPIGRIIGTVLGLALPGVILGAAAILLVRRTQIWAGIIIAAAGSIAGGLIASSAEVMPWIGGILGGLVTLGLASLVGRRKSPS